ncbi:hypothetical protein HDU96_003262 [Phlyctochytrium bullatum]|nr:hypothetical protein HDU96_003262 [Phlyctochytrium bullatum]
MAVLCRLLTDELDHVFADPCLSKRDLLSCALVCKSWMSPAKSALWRDVTLDTGVGGHRVTVLQIKSPLHCLCPDTFHRRLDSLPIAPLHHVRTLTLRLSYRPNFFVQASAVQDAARLSLDYEEDEWGDLLNEDVLKASWDEFVKRVEALGGMLVKIMQAASALRRLELVLDVAGENEALDMMLLWKSLRVLAETAVRTSKTPNRKTARPIEMALRLEEAMAIKRPQYLSPIVLECHAMMTEVRILNGSDWRLDDVEGLLVALPNLKAISLANSFAFREQQVVLLAERHGRQLVELELRNVKNLADKELLRLLPGSFPKLRRFSLSRSLRIWPWQESSIFGEGGTWFGKRLEALEHVDLSWCPSVRKELFAALAASCPHLRTLDASETNMDDEHVTLVLKRCRFLTVLNLAYCGLLTAAVLELQELTEHPRLIELDMHGCQQVAMAETAPDAVLKLAASKRGPRRIVIGIVHGEGKVVDAWRGVAAKFCLDGFGSRMRLSLR